MAIAVITFEPVLASACIAYKDGLLICMYKIIYQYTWIWRYKSKIANVQLKHWLEFLKLQVHADSLGAQELRRLRSRVAQQTIQGLEGQRDREAWKIQAETEEAGPVDRFNMI